MYEFLKLELVGKIRLQILVKFGFAYRDLCGHGRIFAGNLLDFINLSTKFTCNTISYKISSEGTLPARKINVGFFSASDRKHCW